MERSCGLPSEDRLRDVLELAVSFLAHILRVRDLRSYDRIDSGGEDEVRGQNSKSKDTLRFSWCSCPPRPQACHVQRCCQTARLKSCLAPTTVLGLTQSLGTPDKTLTEDAPGARSLAPDKTSNREVQHNGRVMWGQIGEMAAGLAVNSGVESAAQRTGRFLIDAARSHDDGVFRVEAIGMEAQERRQEQSRQEFMSRGSAELISGTHHRDQERTLNGSALQTLLDQGLLPQPSSPHLHITLCVPGIC